MDYDGIIKVQLRNELGDAVSATQLNVKRCTYFFEVNEFAHRFLLASMAVQLQATPKKTSVVEAPMSALDE